ncbi:MAG: aspartate aminotransferase family protein, partial [Planctomycetaceae bacterium]|nr:aspartate aminotransferase family protein [Planctomycetaceae bacterium]
MSTASNRTAERFQLHRNSLAGGVSSSTRVNRAIGRAMLFDRAEGPYLWDLDGRRYLDFCTSHGATLLGHGDPRIVEAVQGALARGAACSYENELHGELAQRLCDTIPCLERVRFTGSGTEATLHCIRLARAFTGKSKLLKFEGNFHGYHDQVMYSINTPVEQLGPEESPKVWPASTGMTPGLEQQLIVLPYNRPDLVERAVAEHAHELAAVLCEPIYFNAGCIRPTAEFMSVLRETTRRHGVLLFFDEVLSAFRMGPGGAQEYLGVTPDLCTLGKAVGGGFPLSVFGGRADIMAKLMPTGDCQHSGTYNGHPVTIAAGIAANRAYRAPGFYEHIRQIGEKLFAGLNQIFARHGVPGRVQGLGARFGIYFGV